VTPLRLRSCTGQSTVEYVGAVLTVAVVVGAVASAAAGFPWHEHVAGAIRLGICRVAGGVCTDEEARRAGLEPCDLQVHESGERTSATIALLHLRRGDTVAFVRRSDGSAIVSFLDESGAGLATSIGLEAAGGVRLSPLSLETALMYVSGRQYAFGSVAEAERFLERHGGQETSMGTLERVARPWCPWCDDGPELAGPDALTRSGGVWGSLQTAFGIDAPRVREAEASVGGEAQALLGTRVEGRDTTYFLRLDGEAAGRLGVVAAGMAGSRSLEAVLGVTVRDGRATRLSLDLHAAAGQELEVLGIGTDLRRIAERLRGVTAGAGAGGAYRVEARLKLDLGAPGARAAAAGVARLIADRVHPSRWDDRVGALGRAFDRSGTVEVASYAQQERTSGGGGRLSVGAGFGVVRETTVSDRRLTGAWAWVGGQEGWLHDREDCSAAA
jgi:hypothetical protein